MPKKNDIAIGTLHGRLTVTGKAESQHGHAYWSVRCACGAASDVRANALRTGAARCGAGCAPSDAAPVDTDTAALKAEIAALKATVERLAPTPAPTAAPAQTLNYDTWMRGAVDRRARIAENHALLRELLDAPQTEENRLLIVARFGILDKNLNPIECGGQEDLHRLRDATYERLYHWGMSKEQIEDSMATSDILLNPVDTKP